MEDVAPEVHRDLDPALLGELQRVPHEVHEALRDATCVTARKRDVVGHRAHQVQSLLGRQWSEAGEDAHDRVLDRVVAQGQLHAPGLDLGEVEHVVDEPEQVLAAVLNVGQRDPQLVRHFPVDFAENQFIESEDRVQRGA